MIIRHRAEFKGIRREVNLTTLFGLWAMRFGLYLRSWGYLYDATVFRNRPGYLLGLI